MSEWIIRTFGLKGSWKWACKRMEQGYIVKQKTATGTVKYKLDHEGQKRIVWTFSRNPQKPHDWESANIFLSDFESTDWIVVYE